MRLDAIARWVPSSDHEYEDAFFPTRERHGIEVSVSRPFRAAVADGTSTASFSGVWARQLALGFVSRRVSSRTLPGCLGLLGTRWVKQAKQRVGGNAAWYLEAKLQQGSAATLLGVELRAAANGSGIQWQAEAVGDSCLAHVREERLLTTFPLTQPEQFSNHPPLIHTRIARERIPDVAVVDGEALPGDSFYLMTDALAKWFIQEGIKGERPWVLLSGFGQYAGPTFEDWVINQRASGQMDDDDVTLFSIQATE